MQTAPLSTSAVIEIPDIDAEVFSINPCIDEGMFDGFPSVLTALIFRIAADKFNLHHALRAVFPKELVFGIRIAHIDQTPSSDLALPFSPAS